MIKLSDRLELIYNLIEENETMADIGTDHGFLPVALWERNKCKKIVLSDINIGPLKKAEENITKINSSIPLDIRLGAGLETIELGEVDTVVIAGMGGLLIADILKDDIEKAKILKKVIMQPRNNQGKLRLWLKLNGFVIEKDRLVIENKYICQVIQAKYSFKNNSKEACNYKKPEIHFELPEIDLAYKDPLIFQFVNNKIKIEKNILNRILGSKNPYSDKNTTKVKQIGERIEYMEKYLLEVELKNGN